MTSTDLTKNSNGGTSPLVSKRTSARQPSRTALATRSATATMTLTGDVQREALRQHFAQFPPSITKRVFCWLRVAE